MLIINNKIFDLVRSRIMDFVLVLLILFVIAAPLFLKGEATKKMDSAKETTTSAKIVNVPNKISPSTECSEVKVTPIVTPIKEGVGDGV